MSIISILGTALAIMMIMSIIVSEEISNANVAPENNRSRTLYIKREYGKDTLENNSWSGSLQADNYKRYISDLETPKYVSAINKGRATVQVEGMKEKLFVETAYTDANYWHILSFDFVEGRPFNKEEFESGIKHAVISEKTYRKLTKGENIADLSLLINQTPYKIIGVVKDIPPVFELAKSRVWIPYTASSTPPRSFTAMLMLENSSDLVSVTNEIREREKRYRTENVPRIIEFIGPINHRTLSLSLSPQSGEDLRDLMKVHHRKKIFIFIILLLVPAINLSGFSISRIKKRMSEIGVRKAFGAKKHIILVQVLFENFITSIIGGIIGLICSYVVVFRMRDWLLGIPADGSIPISTLVSPDIFIAVFTICLLINLLSAGIPAWRASRVTIINSLNQNDKQS